MEANPLAPADLAAIRAFAKGSADYLRNYHKKEDDIGSELDPDDAVTLCDFFEDDVPRLLATVEALRAENERLRASEARLAIFDQIAERAVKWGLGKSGSLFDAADIVSAIASVPKRKEPEA